MFSREPKEPKRLLPKPPGRFARWRTSLGSRIRNLWKRSWRETKIIYQARWNRLKRLPKRILFWRKESVAGFKVGQLVNWESQGSLQFPKPRKLVDFSDDKAFAFVEGSKTGIPVGQLVLVNPPKEPQTPKAQKQRLSRHYFYALAAAGLVVASVLTQSVGVPVGKYFWWMLASLAGLAILIWVGIILFSNRDKVSKHWKPILSTVGVIAVVGLIGFGIYRIHRYNVHGDEVARRQEMSNRAARAALLAKLRNATVLASDTTLVVAATLSGTNYFVPDHGCSLATSEVNPSHAYVLVNQEGRHEVLPGKDVYVGKSEWFRLYALGGPVTEVEVKVFDCPRSKEAKQTKPPKRRSA